MPSIRIFLAHASGVLEGSLTLELPNVGAEALSAVKAIRAEAPQLAVKMVTRGDTAVVTFTGPTLKTWDELVSAFSRDALHPILDAFLPLWGMSGVVVRHDVGRETIDILIDLKVDWRTMAARTRAYAN